MMYEDNSKKNQKRGKVEKQEKEKNATRKYKEKRVSEKWAIRKRREGGMRGEEWADSVEQLLS